MSASLEIYASGLERAPSELKRVGMNWRKLKRVGACSNEWKQSWSGLKAVEMN